jgi:hypothetical protein
MMMKAYLVGITTPLRFALKSLRASASEPKAMTKMNGDSHLPCLGLPVVWFISAMQVKLGVQILTIRFRLMVIKQWGCMKTLPFR